MECEWQYDEFGGKWGVPLGKVKCLIGKCWIENGSADGNGGVQNEIEEQAQRLNIIIFYSFNLLSLKN